MKEIEQLVLSPAIVCPECGRMFFQQRPMVTEGWQKVIYMEHGGGASDAIAFLSIPSCKNDGKAYRVVMPRVEATEV